MSQSDGITGRLQRELDGWSGSSEADVRGVLVEPVLTALGWSMADTAEVRREYGQGGSRKPSYALLYNEMPVVRVEVIDLDGDIAEAEELLEEFSEYTHPVATGVATDGKVWKIMTEGKWGGVIDVAESTDILADLSQISKSEIIDAYEEKIIGKKILKMFGGKGASDCLQSNIGWRRHIDDANKAMRLLNQFVVSNRSRFEDRESFNQALRAYSNIIFIANGEKRILSGLLEDELFTGLDKDSIIKLSTMGKYIGIQRRPPNIDSESDIASFLDLMEVFSHDGQYAKQANRLKKFTARNFLGTPTLTGILASLQPDDFMAYNQRSYKPLRDTLYSELAKNVSLKKYPRFNNLYRSISRKTGKSLVELEIIVNFM